MIKDAKIDASEKYRYWLLRSWDNNLPCMTYVMLNPSTADASNDDPTIRRCISFAKSWGYGSLEVVNLFAFRATKPVDLLNCEDPIGLDNDSYIMQSYSKSELIVAAWGTYGALNTRNVSVENLITSKFDIHCLNKTIKGHPRHPLYVKGDTELLIYKESFKEKF
ncbi:DUF1643 domain-containing protein [Paenibacillus pini]|uniref:DUF1643 domain-containing protein n=1 Tax=Paenibacillus pini TaxID=669461 RepID=UPI00055E0DB3|nr:DUF1643 domain-containing protein [Paenibacillus pini]